MKRTDYLAKEIIREGKIKYLGRCGKFLLYDVAGVEVRYSFGRFECNCKDCVMYSLPRGMEARCCYVKALKLLKEVLDDKTNFNIGL